ncbi:unnamed protein product [Calicophoron daubneyi]|uniref:LicD/FKTN/FKRP nucleotidyltransferase domain-containing protein n=1 Tax=Calicophoron daubneyi TaxID=300641 RepID=A0AAV2TBZ7_CALDB
MLLSRLILILTLVTVSLINIILLSRTIRFASDNSDVDPEIHRFQVSPYMRRKQSSQLPDLYAIDWPRPIVSKYPAGVPQGDGRSRYLPPPFGPAMSIGQLRLYRRLMRVFSDVMFDNGMGDRFMLTAGTLVGSFHHHDFIPWDDEVDFMVDVSVRDKVRTLLGRLEPEYQMALNKNRDKFFAKASEYSTIDTNVELSLPIPRYKWNWPFLDLLYYESNETHVAEINPSYVKQMSWPKDVIFPLYFRPFGPAWFPAPKNPLAFLRMRYGNGSTCKIAGYSHVIEDHIPNATSNCQELVTRYPFVVHKPCGLIRLGNKRREMVLGEESLSVHSAYWSPSVIHTMCLAVAEESSRAHLYDYSRI